MQPEAPGAAPAVETAAPADMAPASARTVRRLRGLKIGAVLVVALMLVAAHRFGVLEVFAEPAKVKEALLRIGPWGYVAFVGAYTVLQPFGVPGTVFIMAAPLIWSWPVAFALSMTGTMSASVVGFSFSRFVARDWVSKMIPARFRAYDEALAKRGFATVATLRFLFWMPPMLHAFFGLSKVRFWTHFWGSFVGYLVPLFLVSFFGERVFEWLRAAPVSAWIGMVAAFAAIVFVVFWVRRRRGAVPR